eukprot:UN02977
MCECIYFSIFLQTYWDDRSFSIFSIFVTGTKNNCLTVCAYNF